MKLLIATFFNILLTSIWAIVFVFISFLLISDFNPGETFFLIIPAWILNAFITLLLHVLIYIPSLLIGREKIDYSSEKKSFQIFFPILVIPLLIYSILLYLIGMNITFSNLFIQTTLVFGITLMITHSISLFTLLSRIINQKILHHEKFN